MQMTVHMPQDKPNRITRPLFFIESEEPKVPETVQEIADRKNEARRVVRRLSNIVVEHHESSLALGVSLGASEIYIVTTALRDHAQGGPGTLALDGCDEILSHCLTRLYEELVEEPSNILYLTPTSPDTIRYDAMNPSFWIECLDLLEQNITSKKDE